MAAVHDNSFGLQTPQLWFPPALDDLPDWGLEPLHVRGCYARECSQHFTALRDFSLWMVHAKTEKAHFTTEVVRVMHSTVDKTGIEKELILEVTCNSGDVTWRVLSFWTQGARTRIDDPMAISAGTEFLTRELLRFQ